MYTLTRVIVPGDFAMRFVTKPTALPLLALALVVSAVFVSAPGVRAQQGAARARKQLLVFTYPRVGPPASHGHASLKPAPAQTVARAKGGGLDVTAPNGYDPAVG